jgi:hypothetical protein
MFADLERYKSLEKDWLLSSTVNQFSGLVYVPAITYTTNFQNSLGTAGAVTINVDNATCIIQGSPTVYSAYFIPGYMAETAAIANRFQSVNLGSTEFLDLFDKEVLITHINPQYWYPNNYPSTSWSRPRQNPYTASYFFHMGSSKTYVGTANYYQYSESGLFLLNLLEVYQPIPNMPNNNVDVRVTSSGLTYQPYTASSGVIQSLPKNIIINYVKRFPDRLV